MNSIYSADCLSQQYRRRARTERSFTISPIRTIAPSCARIRYVLSEALAHPGMTGYGVQIYLCDSGGDHRGIPSVNAVVNVFCQHNSLTELRMSRGPGCVRHNACLPRGHAHTTNTALRDADGGGTSRVYSCIARTHRYRHGNLPKRDDRCVGHADASPNYVTDCDVVQDMSCK